MSVLHLDYCNNQSDCTIAYMYDWFSIEYLVLGIACNYVTLPINYCEKVR